MGELAASLSLSLALYIVCQRLDFTKYQLDCFTAQNGTRALFFQLNLFKVPDNSRL